jgi:Iap family predicted aminopeptidase
MRSTYSAKLHPGDVWALWSQSMSSGDVKGRWWENAMSINVDGISWRCLVLAAVAVLGEIATSAIALEMCLAPFECSMVGEIVLIWPGERHDEMTFF